MGYAIEYAATAMNRLRRLDAKTIGRIMAKVTIVGDDPRAQNPNVKPLTGVDGYRLRVGGWRVIFDLDHRARRLIVREIRERGGAYRRRQR